MRTLESYGFLINYNNLDRTTSYYIYSFFFLGFYRPPADYYFRPFSLAMEAESHMWHNNYHCFGEHLETEINLNYVHRQVDIEVLP